MNECTSYLTADEVRAAQVLHQRAPYALTNVSHGFFSIARHYGGLTFQDCHYTYMPGHDECVRDDVLMLVAASLTVLKMEGGKSYFLTYTFPKERE